MKRIVIHVLNYRAIDALRTGSLREIAAAARRIRGAEVRLVFQDNYSQDGSLELAMEIPEADVLLSRENLMYTGGVNSGLQYIEHCYHPDYVILSDADNFCREDAYDQLFRMMERHPELGMVQPMVAARTRDGKLYSCGHRYADGIFCRPMRELPADPRVLLDLPSCSICSTMVRMDALRKVGLLNDIFRIYYESSDLSFRLRKAGYRCACCTDAVAYNEGTRGTSASNYHEAYYRLRNGLIFWRIHDTERYLQMCDHVRRELEPLQTAYEASEFCTDCVAESTRRGIADGLALCSRMDGAQLSAGVARADRFDKSLVILLKKGVPCHA